jgi:hypothetical protein
MLDVGSTTGLTVLPEAKRERGQGKEMFMGVCERIVKARGKDDDRKIDTS